jgi:WD40 repeat protein
VLGSLLLCWIYTNKFLLSFLELQSGSILVWKATDSESDPFKYLTSLEGHHSGEVTCFVVGGEVLYSGSVDKTIKVRYGCY